jgi:DNA-binding response OmpR family regulator
MQQLRQVLVIEDDPAIVEVVELGLGKHGFDVISAPDAVTGLRMAYMIHPHAIILDVMMPAMDGFEACRRLREMTDVPILFLTGKATTADDIIKGFDLGADEYITKPFRFAELVSRLRARLRRTESSSNENGDFISPVPSVILDCGRHELTVKGRTVYLRPKEFEVLQLLMHHAGRVLPQDAILTRVWGLERIGDRNLIKQSIYQWRKKIEADPHEPEYIQTIPSEGYYFSTVDPA